MSSAGPEWTVDDHMRAGSEQTVALYLRFEQVVRSLGVVTLSVAKTTITFKGPRRGFAGARPTPTAVVGYFDLMRQLPPDRRIRGASPYGRNLFVHRFVLLTDGDLDDDFVGWLREAYAVGEGAHLLHPPS